MDDMLKSLGQFEKITGKPAIKLRNLAKKCVKIKKSVNESLKRKDHKTFWKLIQKEMDATDALEKETSKEFGKIMRRLKSRKLHGS
jgi:hypothetical protein